MLVVIAMPSILLEMLTLALAGEEIYDFGKVGPKYDQKI